MGRGYSLFLLITQIWNIGKMITELEREADRMCNMCFSEKKISTKTTFTVEHDGCIIVVKNVPCWECPICGEIIFSDVVSAKLEELVSAAKKIWQEISVIDFSRAA